jgi:hypothetical protein
MEKYVKIIVVVIVIGATGYVAYDQIQRWNERSVDTALSKEQTVWKIKTEILEEKISSLEGDLAQQQDTLVPRERLLEVFGEDSTVVSPEQRAINCGELENHITSFFTYLDKKGYAKSYEMEDGMYELFHLTVTQLSGKPPMVSGEMKDLSSLIRNMAHFYRTLGKKRIGLFKDIVKNESEIIESLMLVFFSWATSGDRCKEIARGYPTLEVMYEYAGFFLNTLSGKSYLSRRDSKFRILATYYSILTVDRANEETLNRHGIDIRPHIDFLFYDINSQRALIYKKQYLKGLVGLKKKYQN